MDGSAEGGDEDDDAVTGSAGTIQATLPQDDFDEMESATGVAEDDTAEPIGTATGPAYGGGMDDAGTGPGQDEEATDLRQKIVPQSRTYTHTVSRMQLGLSNNKKTKGTCSQTRSHIRKATRSASSEHWSCRDMCAQLQ